jgi:hypothetical protein
VIDADRVDEPKQEPDRAADAAEALALAEEAEAEAAEAEAIAAAARARACDPAAQTGAGRGGRRVVGEGENTRRPRG